MRPKLISLLSIRVRDGPIEVAGLWWPKKICNLSWPCSPETFQGHANIRVPFHRVREVYRDS